MGGGTKWISFVVHTTSEPHGLFVKRPRSTNLFVGAKVGIGTPRIGYTENRFACPIPLKKNIKIDIDSTNISLKSVGEKITNAVPSSIDFRYRHAYGV